MRLGRIFVASSCGVRCAARSISRLPVWSDTNRPRASQRGVTLCMYPRPLAWTTPLSCSLPCQSSIPRSPSLLLALFLGSLSRYPYLLLSFPLGISLFSHHVALSLSLCLPACSALPCATLVNHRSGVSEVTIAPPPWEWRPGADIAPISSTLGQLW